MLLREQIEKGQKLPLDHVAIAPIPAALVWKHQVARFLVLGL